MIRKCNTDFNVTSKLIVRVFPVATRRRSSLSLSLSLSPPALQQIALVTGGAMNNGRWQIGCGEQAPAVWRVSGRDELPRRTRLPSIRQERPLRALGPNPTGGMPDRC
jgi:hypothetical protein